MKRFFMFSALLIAITVFFSCQKENEGLNADTYLKQHSSSLPAGVEYKDGGIPVPGLGERTIRFLTDHGGILKVDPNDPSLWTIDLPENQQPIVFRDGGRDGICLWGQEYFSIPNAECTSANGWDIDLIYTQGQQAKGKFYTFDYPWLKWGEDGALVQSGLDAFADSIYVGLIDIGVPPIFNVCIDAFASDYQGSHHYIMVVYVNGLPSGVEISFRNIFTINCNGAGYANFEEAELGVNPQCSNQPTACDAWGGGY